MKTCAESGVETERKDEGKRARIDARARRNTKGKASCLPVLLGIFILGSCGTERPEQSERSKLAVTGADGQTDDRATSEEATPVLEEKEKKNAQNKENVDDSNTRLMGHWITAERINQEEIGLYNYVFMEDGVFYSWYCKYTHSAYFDLFDDYTGWYIEPKSHSSFGGSYTFDGEYLALQYYYDEENGYYGMGDKIEYVSVSGDLIYNAVFAGRIYFRCDEFETETHELYIEEFCERIGVDCSVY